MHSYKYSKETRDVILNAAKKEFAERGYSGARMSSIAKRAGVNQALIHYYFSSKEKLYREVLEFLFHHEESRIIEEYFKEDVLTPPEALYVAIYILVYLHHDAIDPETNRIISWEIAEGGETFKKLLIEYLYPRLDRITLIIKQGIEQGYFETSDPFLIVFNLVNFIISFENNKQYLKDTHWYGLFYGGDDGRRLFEYTLNATFKALTPKRKVLALPHISNELQNKLHIIINKLKSAQGERYALSKEV
ncbi:MAG: TetR/AcrR family transcriptional regulator [Spirochaetota bacterium]|nr:TetR/AcrR family transcriptional regulator [Spirochaetota bacterium]